MPRTLPDPALGISAKVAGGKIGGWMSRKREEDWQSFHEQRQTKSFLEISFAKRARYVINQKTAKNNAGTANRLLSFKRTLNWGWYSVPGVIDVNEHVKQLYMFFVTVQHWQH
jgi:hypothetical protein